MSYDRTKIQSPVGLTLFGIAVIVGSVAGAVNISDPDQGGTVGVVIMLMLALFGCLVTYIGVRRWVWRNKYVKIMGHSPWEEES